MRIAIISTMAFSRWGGSEELWAACASAALAAGHEVMLSVHRESTEAPRVQDLVHRGARVHGRRVIPPNRIGRAFSRYVSVFEPVLRWRPEVVLISQGGTYDLVLNGQAAGLHEALQLVGVPYVVVCHGNGEMVLGDADRAVAKAFFADARRVCFVAERMVQLAQRQLAGALPNATVVKNPVNMTSTAPLPWPEAAPVKFATVGRLEAHVKGYDLLFEALAQAPWTTRPWTLSLYGEGPSRKYLEELAGYFGIHDRLHFAGHTNDIRAIWAENHLLIQPSRTEGVPLALVEAMLCGRPAVVTNVGGMSEWVAEPATGFIAAGAATAAIGEAMERAWLRRAQWYEMGQRAREVAVARIAPNPGGALLRILDETQTGKMEAN